MKKLFFALVLSCLTLPASATSSLPQVFDANDQQVGYVLTPDATGAIILLDVGDGIYVKVNSTPSHWYDPHSVIRYLYFTGSDCTGDSYYEGGTEYISEGLVPYHSHFIVLPHSVFIDGGQPENVTVSSRRRNNTSTVECQSYEDTLFLDPAIEVVAPGTFTPPFKLRFE